MVEKYTTIETVVPFSERWFTNLSNTVRKLNLEGAETWLVEETLTPFFPHMANDGVKLESTYSPTVHLQLKLYRGVYVLIKHSTLNRGDELLVKLSFSPEDLVSGIDADLIMDRLGMYLEFRTGGSRTKNVYKRKFVRAGDGSYGGIPFHELGTDVQVAFLKLEGPSSPGELHLTPVPQQKRNTELFSNYWMHTLVGITESIKGVAIGHAKDYAVEALTELGFDVPKVEISRDKPVHFEIDTGLFALNVQADKTRLVESTEIVFNHDEIGFLLVYAHGRFSISFNSDKYKNHSGLVLTNEELGYSIGKDGHEFVANFEPFLGITGYLSMSFGGRMKIELHPSGSLTPFPSYLLFDKNLGFFLRDFEEKYDAIIDPTTYKVFKKFSNSEKESQEDATSSFNENIGENEMSKYLPVHSLDWFEEVKRVTGIWSGDPLGFNKGRVEKGTSLYDLVDLSKICDNKTIHSLSDTGLSKRTAVQVAGGRNDGLSRSVELGYTPSGNLRLGGFTVKTPDTTVVSFVSSVVVNGEPGWSVIVSGDKLCLAFVSRRIEGNFSASKGDDGSVKIAITKPNKGVVLEFTILGSEVTVDYVSEEFADKLRLQHAPVKRKPVTPFTYEWFEKFENLPHTFKLSGTWEDLKQRAKTLPLSQVGNFEGILEDAEVYPTDIHEVIEYEVKVGGRQMSVHIIELHNGELAMYASLDLYDNNHMGSMELLNLVSDTHSTHLSSAGIEKVAILDRGEYVRLIGLEDGVPLLDVYLDKVETFEGLLSHPELVDPDKLSSICVPKNKIEPFTQPWFSRIVDIVDSVVGMGREVSLAKIHTELTKLGLENLYQEELSSDETLYKFGANGLDLHLEYSNGVLTDDYNFYIEPKIKFYIPDFDASNLLFYYKNNEGYLAEITGAVENGVRVSKTLIYSADISFDDEGYMEVTMSRLVEGESDLAFLLYRMGGEFVFGLYGDLEEDDQPEVGLIHDPITLPQSGDALSNRDVPTSFSSPWFEQILAFVDSVEGVSVERAGELASDLLYDLGYLTENPQNTAELKESLKTDDFEVKSTIVNGHVLGIPTVRFFLKHEISNPEPFAEHFALSYNGLRFVVGLRLAESGDILNLTADPSFADSEPAFAFECRGTSYGLVFETYADVKLLKEIDNESEGTQPEVALVPAELAQLGGEVSKRDLPVRFSGSWFAYILSFVNSLDGESSARAGLLKSELLYVLGYLSERPQNPSELTGSFKTEDFEVKPTIVNGQVRGVPLVTFFSSYGVSTSEPFLEWFSLTYTNSRFHLLLRSRDTGGRVSFDIDSADYFANEPTFTFKCNGTPYALVFETYADIKLVKEVSNESDELDLTGLTKNNRMEGRHNSPKATPYSSAWFSAFRSIMRDFDSNLSKVGEFLQEGDFYLFNYGDFEMVTSDATLLEVTQSPRVEAKFQGESFKVRVSQGSTRPWMTITTNLYLEEFPDVSLELSTQGTNVTLKGTSNGRACIDEPSGAIHFNLSMNTDDSFELVDRDTGAVLISSPNMPNTDGVILGAKLSENFYRFIGHKKPVVRVSPYTPKWFETLEEASRSMCYNRKYNGWAIDEVPSNIYEISEVFEELSDNATMAVVENTFGHCRNTADCGSFRVQHAFYPSGSWKDSKGLSVEVPLKVKESSFLPSELWLDYSDGKLLLLPSGGSLTGVTLKSIESSDSASSVLVFEDRNGVPDRLFLTDGVLSAVGTGTGSTPVLEKEPTATLQPYSPGWFATLLNDSQNLNRDVSNYDYPEEITLGQVTDSVLFQNANQTPSSVTDTGVSWVSEGLKVSLDFIQLLAFIQLTLKPNTAKGFHEPVIIRLRPDGVLVSVAGRVAKTTLTVHNHLEGTYLGFYRAGELVRALVVNNDGCYREVNNKVIEFGGKLKGGLNK